MLMKLTPCVNFINFKRAHFLYECHFGSFFYVCTYIEKAAKMTFVQKMRVFNVDEINSMSNERKKKRRNEEKFLENSISLMPTVAMVMFEIQLRSPRLMTMFRSGKIFCTLFFIIFWNFWALIYIQSHPVYWRFSSVILDWLHFRTFHIYVVESAPQIWTNLTWLDFLMVDRF